MEQFRSCPQGAQAYTWSAADSLSSLASGRGVSEQAIRQANPGIDFDQIEAGTSICVPARPLSCPNGLLHTVRAGESIESIARSYSTTSRELMDRNPYIDPTGLRAGQRICVPQLASGPEPLPPGMVPAEPSQPSTPNQPSQPSTPSTPNQPSQPSTPSTPSRPTPSQPSQPSTPSRPTPSQPSQPSTPSRPTPSQPSQPSTPSRPTPSQPSQPSTPSRPTPSQPSLPSTPSTPSRPTPSQPSLPTLPRCPAGYTSGTVQYGQSYADLLVRNNVSYQAFQLANPSLNLTRLIPGQRYCVPPTGSRGLCSGNGQSYIIEQDETLNDVARRFRTTPAILLRANANLAPRDFIPGRVICLG